MDTPNVLADQSVPESPVAKKPEVEADVDDAETVENWEEEDISKTKNKLN